MVEQKECGCLGLRRKRGKTVKNMTVIKNGLNQQRTGGPMGLDNQ